jgi:hypothetical protein
MPDRLDPDRTEPKEHSMNADANGHSSAALIISVTPDPRSSPSNWQPTLDARAPSPRNPRDLNLAEQDRRRRYERQADLRIQARVKHPDGGERTVLDTHADEKAQREKIIRERDMGSRKHDRLPPWLRQIPKLVLLFNFVLVLYFFAEITNVDWQGPVSMGLAFASALAAMVTVSSFGFLAFTGHRLHYHKDHDGIPDALDGLTKAVAGAAMVVTAVLAVLMYVCIHSEILDALGGQAGEIAFVVPLSAAVVGTAANSLVVLIYAMDGSEEVARLDMLAAATRRPAGKAHKLRRRAAHHVYR